jgi:L-seryl-tRNA(Ser) seleniumtransferase
MANMHRSEFLDRLDVKEYLNAQNWSTSIGGTFLEPEVLEVMKEVSQTFVDIRELHDKACVRIAELCQVDSAYITAGAAAGIVLCTAACIAGTHSARWKTLPFTEDPPINGRNQIIIQATQLVYKEQFTAGGARLVQVGGPLGCKLKEIEEAVTEKTVAIAAGYHYNIVPGGWVPYEKVTEVARKHNLPCFCDAAGVFPPYVNLHKLSDWGFDLVIFSGGKGIRGPQETGLILGKGERGKKLIKAIKDHSSPNFGFGRAFKVSKECIAGIVVALEIALGRGEQKEYEKQLSKAKYMVKQLEDIPGISVSVVPNDGKTYEHPLMARVPNVKIDIDKAALGLDTVGKIYDAMRNGEPGIFIRSPRFEDPEFGPFTNRASVFLFTYYLRDGEEEIVAKRMREVLTKCPWRR